MALTAFVLLAWTLAMPSARQSPAPAPSTATIVVVVLETDKGAIEIEIDPARAPITAANFLKYVDGGFYDAGEFHRTVRPDTETNRTHPIQVIQARRARGRQGFPAIALERTSTTGLKHVNGAVSMARQTGQPDSATSDFFICIGDQPALDQGGGRNDDNQGFAAFGRVVSGMDVVRAIQASPVRPGTQTLQPPVRIVKAYRKK
jgi:peptidyl-prolyl cis-trans isomerase A (cyclophilin A)